MKLSLKPLVLYISLSTLGLCGIISSASANAPVDNKIKVISQIVKVYNMPTKRSNSLQLTIPRDLGLTSLGQLLTKPLLQLPINRTAAYPMTPVKKKNQLFEMANIFNDKLQQFISTLSGNKKGKMFFGDMTLQDCDSKQDL